MIFKYKTLSVSKKVQLDIDIIRANQKSIIRNANITANGLILNEEIDNSLITLEYENLAEQRLLLGEMTNNDFYFDDARNKYLSLETTTVDFYLDGSNKKLIYMYNTPGISSSSVPFKIFSDYCLTGIEFYGSTPIPKGTPLVQVNNVATGDIIYTYTTTSSSNEYSVDNLNLDILSGTKIGAYMMNFGVNTPVFKIYLKKIYTPVGA